MTDPFSRIPHRRLDPTPFPHPHRHHPDRSRGRRRFRGSRARCGRRRPRCRRPPAPKGPIVRRAGPARRRAARRRRHGFNEPMPVQIDDLPADPRGQGPDGAVAHRLGQDRRLRHPDRERLVSAEDKFVQAIVLLPTRELALQVAAELARICAHSSIKVVPGLRRRADGPADRAAASAGGQIVCGTPGPRARSPAPRHAAARSRALRRAGRVRRDAVDGLPGGHRGHPRAARRRTRQTLLFSATVPEGIQRLARRFLRNPEFLKLSGDYVGVHEIRHVYYSIPGGAARGGAAAHPGRSRTRSGHHLLQHARGDRPGRRVPARARATTPRRSRRTCRRPIASG